MIDNTILCLITFGSGLGSLFGGMSSMYTRPQIGVMLIVLGVLLLVVTFIIVGLIIKQVNDDYNQRVNQTETMLRNANCDQLIHYLKYQDKENETEQLGLRLFNLECKN